MYRRKSGAVGRCVATDPIFQKPLRLRSFGDEDACDGRYPVNGLGERIPVRTPTRAPASVGARVHLIISRVFVRLGRTAAGVFDGHVFADTLADKALPHFDSALQEFRIGHIDGDDIVLIRRRPGGGHIK